MPSKKTPSKKKQPAAVEDAPVAAMARDIETLQNWKSEAAPQKPVVEQMASHYSPTDDDILSQGMNRDDATRLWFGGKTLPKVIAKVLGETDRVLAERAFDIIMLNDKKVDKVLKKLAPAIGNWRWDREQALFFSVRGKKNNKKSKKLFAKAAALAAETSHWPEIRIRDVKQALRKLTVQELAQLSRRPCESGVVVVVGFSGKSEELNGVYAIERLTSLVVASLSNPVITLADDSTFKFETSGCARRCVAAWQRLNERAMRKKKGMLTAEASLDVPAIPQELVSVDPN